MIHRKAFIKNPRVGGGGEGSVLLLGSGGLGIGPEHSPRGWVRALLEEGPGCCRVCTRLGLIPLGESC